MPWVLEEFLLCVVLDDLALVQEDDAVGGLPGEVYLMDDGHYGHLGLGEFPHDFQDLPHLDVHRRGRLV